MPTPKGFLEAQKHRQLFQEGFKRALLKIEPQERELLARLFEKMAGSFIEGKS